MDGRNTPPALAMPSPSTLQPQAQRDAWTRRKDAVVAKFRRDCHAEVARVK